MGLLVIPHVREPHEPVHVLQYEVVPLVLLPVAVMVVLPREAQVEPEPGHHALHPGLRGEQRPHVLRLQPGAHLPHEDVVDVDQQHPLERQTQLAVAEVAQGIQEQEPVQPEFQARAEDHPLDVVV